jgi:PD-(D/E)XK endonuclease
MSKRRAFRGRKSRPAQASPAPTRAQTPFERELTTKRRGEISELAFALAAARHGFGIARPYGDSERYDIILDPSHLDPYNPQARPRLVRVQVKSSTQLVNGLYHINAGRRLNGRVVPYTLAEIDFIAAYIIPEDSWFILPLPHVLGQVSLLFRPKRSRIPGVYDDYREAWHHLREPDGLEFA